MNTSNKSKMVLRVIRETEHFRAYRTKNGVRIVAKDKDVEPRSKVIPVNDWLLNQTNDFEFDGTIVLEIGVGTFQKPRKESEVKP
ncbi:MAG: hypothetical protein ACREFE_15240 [Limisphaerales bacterium]